jgi:hypothetical protein
VETELARVQQTIERIDGRLRVLDDQTTFSTLAVEVTEKGSPEAGPKSTLAKAWDDAVSAFLSVIAAVIVGAAVALPIGLIGLVGVLVYRRARPRVETSTT